MQKNYAEISIADLRKAGHKIALSHFDTPPRDQRRGAMQGLLAASQAVFEPCRKPDRSGSVRLLPNGYRRGLISDAALSRAGSACNRASRVVAWEADRAF
jgi:hypothetical protein